jgi:predicted ThiF/HesA family dinucleotide-utilizing enzyme
MPIDKINRLLCEMPIFSVSSINGRVVTRWALNLYELDTWGTERLVTIDEARHSIEG